MTFDHTKSETPLAAWLRRATPKQRERAAALAGTSVNYLYQLAGRVRSIPKADLAFALEDAFRVLHQESGGTLAAITARELATASVIADFPDAP